MTVPDELIEPETFAPLLITHVLLVLLYVTEAYGPDTGPTAIPPPLAADAVAALLAMLITKSFVVIVVESI